MPTQRGWLRAKTTAVGWKPRRWRLDTPCLPSATPMATFIWAPKSPSLPTSLSEWVQRVFSSRILFNKFKGLLHSFLKISSAMWLYFIFQPKPSNNFSSAWSTIQLLCIHTHHVLEILQSAIISMCLCSAPNAFNNASLRTQPWRSTKSSAAFADHMTWNSDCVSCAGNNLNFPLCNIQLVTSLP